MSAPAAEVIPARLAVPAPGELAVWWMTIDVGDEALARAAEAVDAATLARSRRMRREPDQRRTLLAHALLRRLLSAVTGVAPAEVVLERRCASCGSTDHGRPFLPGGASFGLSHGGDVVAVALGAPEASAAVDVEAVQREARWEAVRKAAFSDAEWAATAADPSVARTQLWCRKEAAVKATGHGLSLALTRVSFSPANRGDEQARSSGAGDHSASAGDRGAAPLAGARLVIALADGDPPAPAGPWAAADITLAAGHCAAVAWHGDPAAAITTHRAAL